MKVNLSEAEINHYKTKPASEKLLRVGSSVNAAKLDKDPEVEQLLANCFENSGAREPAVGMQTRSKRQKRKRI